MRRVDAVAAGAERLSRVLIVAAVFLVPLAMDPRSLDAFNLAKMTVLWVLSVAALGAWIFARYLAPERGVLWQSTTMRHAAVLVVVTTLATALSTNRMLSFYGLYHRYEGLASLVLYVFVAGLIFMLYRKRPDALREIAIAIALATSLVSIYVIAQGFGVDPFHWEINPVETARTVGSLGNADFASSYIGMGVPFLLHLAITERGKRRMAWSGGVVLVLIGIAFTQARGGIVAAVTGTLALALFTRRVPARRKAIIIASAFVLLGLSPYAAKTLPFGHRGDLLRTGTVVYRTQMWQAGLGMVASRPILGWGPETYHATFSRYRPADDARARKLVIPDKPHNIFVNWAVTTGVVGLAAYLVLVGGALRLVITRAPASAGLERNVAIAFGAGLVAYLAQGLFSIDVPPLALMGWVTLGAIAATVDRKRTDAPTGNRDRGRPRPSKSPWFAHSYIPLAAIEMTLVVLIGLGLAPLRADHAALAGLRQPWNAIDLYEKARRLNSHEAGYIGLEASYFERVADDPSSLMGSSNALQRSASLWEDAIELQPGNVTFLLAAARVYSRLGTTVDPVFFTKADRWLAEATRLDPRDPEVHGIYSALLGQWADSVTIATDREELEHRAQVERAEAEALQAAS